MNIIIFLIISLIFLFSSLNLSDLLIIKGIICVYALLLSLVIIPLFSKEKIFRINIPLLITFYVFTFFCAFSSLVNSDFDSLFGVMMTALLFLAAIVFVPMVNKNINKTVFFSILLSQVPLLFIPLLGEYETVQYQGFFYNPNALGTTSVVVFTVLFARFLMSVEKIIKGVKEKRKKSTIFIQVLLMLSVFYLIILSGSRTGFTASLACLIVGGFYLLLYLIKYKKLASFIIRGGFLGAISFMVILLLFKFTPLYNALYLNILYKFEDSIRRGDLLSNRGSIWDRVLNDAEFFGKGGGYFMDIGIGAHNTFVGILGQYGWIPLITFLIFLVVSFHYSAKLTLKKTQDDYKYLPLLLFISFLALSAGEDMLFHLSMVTMFFSLGSILEDKKTAATQAKATMNKPAI